MIEHLEAVCDADYGKPRQSVHYIMEYAPLCFAIECRCGFVEYEYAPFGKQCTGYGYTLCLTFR